MHRILLALLAVCLVSACSSVPKLESDPETETIRAQYLRDNPEGTYNEHIMRGEVVKGMTFVEVLASWGVPTRRDRNARATTEEWLYQVQDEGTTNYFVYELVFTDRVLAKWTFGRHTAGIGARVLDPQASNDLPLPAGMPFASGTKRIN